MSLIKYTLPNGIRVIEDQMVDAQSFTLLLMFKTGSRNETPDIWGISHFLEHMAFKGTKSYPGPDLLIKELDSLGVMYNAFTSKEHTGYYIKGSKRVFERALKIMAEMTTDPIISEAEVNKERGTIIEEINMSEDNPQRKLYDYFEECLYTDKYVSQLIIGTKQSLAGIDAKSINEYRSKYYLAGNLVVSVSGCIPDNLSELISAHFDITGGSTQFLEPKAENREKVNISFRETQQTHMALGFPGISFSNEEKDAAKLLSIIIGGNMSSRMFSEVREKRGLAYYIKTYSDHMEDTGSFVTFASVNNEKATEALSVIKDVYISALETIPDEELRRAKDYVAGILTLQYEDSEYRSETNAAFELYNVDVLSLSERIAKVEALTSEDLRRVATKLVNFDKACLALIGPFKDESEFAKILQADKS